ncbi:MAG TPA: hypothetical protein VJK02_10305 [Anaerolineales bacterium]|nr:hypothetical protein [Anaerolineales bacterium]
MTQAELAAFIVSELDKAGIEVVLSGGAAVSIYTDNRYQSPDIDLIETGLATHSQIQRAMRALGFQGVGRHFEHPDSAWLVEFPGGPPYVGGEPIGPVEEITFTTGKLRLISPTDSVKDRLSAYFHWHDRQSLEQARLVAERKDVDLEELRRWSAKEGMAREFEEIVQQLGTD